MQDWLPYLTTAFRLVDLHDSARTVGAAFVPPSEERPGNANGLWLDIGLLLLEHIHAQDIEASGSWVLLGDFLSEIRARHPQLAEQDVQSVITMLSTPCTITAIRADSSNNRPVSYATKETALLERPAYKVADRCRLTSTGRRAIALARAGESWLYAHHDAEKIITAIKWGDFEQLPRFCALVAQSVRSFAHEITRTLEQPGSDVILDSFLERQDNYLEAIRIVQSTVEGASELLLTGEVIDALERWLSTHSDTELSLHSLQRTLVRLMQSVERLGRHFSDFIARVTSQNRETIGSVRFDRAIIHFALKPPQPETLNTCVLSLGPWRCNAVSVGPEDLIGSLLGDSGEAELPAMSFPDEIQDELPNSMQRFLSAYGNEILTALHAGPISLQEAIEKGWLELDGESVLSQLVGVYSAPSWLANKPLQIAVSFRRGGLKARLDDITYLAGDDLVLALVEKGDDHEP